jgi:hypothetical protein
MIRSGADIKAASFYKHVVTRLIERSADSCAAEKVPKECGTAPESAAYEYWGFRFDVSSSIDTIVLVVRG